MSDDKKVKVRFAPSPTGFLHIGSARTALFNYLFARHEGGTFFLRIEDTDRERSKDEFLQEILSSLKRLGIDWDGELVFQSKRTEYYRAMAEKLIQQGLAYHDDQAIRFRVPKEGKVGFEDLLHGPIEFDLNQHPSLAEDLVIFKSDGSPTYNFAVVCDDADMGITHVIRGDDHINNTPKQTPLYAALGLKQPVFCHIPLILGPDRSRMSKRHGATSIRDYLDEGFLPEAIVNYLSLLGWSPGNNEEILSKEEIIKRFDLKRVLKTGAVFDRAKLEWVNGQYIRKLDVPSLTDKIVPHLDAGASKDRGWLERLVALHQERIFTLKQFRQLAGFFFEDNVDYSPESAAELRKDPRLAAAFKAYAKMLAEMPEFEPKAIEEKSRALMKELGMSGKEFIHPCRVAVTGKTVSPGFFDTIFLLGREKAVKRLLQASEAAVAV